MKSASATFQNSVAQPCSQLYTAPSSVASSPRCELCRPRCNGVTSSMLTMVVPMSVLALPKAGPGIWRLMLDTSVRLLPFRKDNPFTAVQRPFKGPPQ